MAARVTLEWDGCLIPAWAFPAGTFLGRVPESLFGHPLVSQVSGKSPMFTHRDPHMILVASGQGFVALSKGLGF